MRLSVFLAAALILLPMTTKTSLAAGGYSTNFTVLEKKDIAKLTDEQLTETYMNALVEVAARKDFFNRFGFTGKDMDEYKAVLKYRLLLLMEIHSRNLDIPQFERY